MKETIFFGIIAICLIVIGVIFIISMKMFSELLKKAIPVKIKVSCAGSAVPNTPNEIKVQGLYSQKFYDKNNNLVDPNDYIPYYVKGQSMLLCGINDDDVIFTKKIQIDSISFNKPHVYVLERDGFVRQKASIEKDYADYKVRRTWAIVRLGEDNLIECAKQIMETEEFKDLRNKHPKSFLSEDEMIKDFNDERIKKYYEQYPLCAEESDSNHIAIISTTLKSSMNNKVTFSIHPARTIVGEVFYSFKMK